MKNSVFTVVLILVAGFVSAELSEEYETYFEGPAGFLLTKEEKKEWKGVANDAQAEAFVDLFWARRDPDLSTPINEFRQDFNQRVEAADEMYGYGSTRGALSDRGRVLILLGRFSRIDNRPPGAAVSGVAPLGDVSRSGGAMGSAYQDVGSTEIWEYVAEELPVRVGQQFVYAVFVETKVGMNDYILDRTNASTTRVLSKIPETFVKHPDLTEVPRIGLLPGSQPATAAQLTWFEADQRPWPDTAGVVATAGLVSGPRHFLWLHVALPEDTAAARSAVGRLRASASGEDAGSFVVPLDGAAIGDGMYELAIPVEEGQWLLDVAVVGDAGPLAVTTVEVATAEVPAAGTSISPFCWGTDVRQEPDSELGDPFNVGGWHLIPLLDSTFPTSTPDSLNFMAYVLDPELGPEGEPHFEVSMSLYVDGARVTRSPFQPAQLSKLTDGLWMYGSGLPLGRFKQPGDYKLKVELKQKADGTKGVIEMPFTMVEGEPPGSGP